MVPETHYARSGDVRIAYQVVGSGPFDMVFVPGFVSNVEVAWEYPPFAHLLSRLASFSRLIMFDKRGTGLSDRVAGIATLEQRMDDVRAVMDTVGSTQAALLGVSEGGAMSMLFAATYPERTRALVLYGAYAHYPTFVSPPQALETALANLDANWGTAASVRLFAPKASEDPEFRAWWARYERFGASPSAAVALMRMNSEIDIRHVLPAIRVPTLVLHRIEDTRVPVRSGRYLAQHIAAVKHVEIPGIDHVLWVGDVDRAVDEIEEFLTGSRPLPESNRVLATLLFTDIVDSTKHAHELGDRKWRLLLDQHDGIARLEIARLRGRVIKTLGDGFLATFDGPARAVRCAAAITEGVKSLDIAVRSGIHTGEIEFKGEDVSGIAVHIAARVAAIATAGQVLVSSTVRDLVAGSGLSFRDAGAHTFKGFSEEMRIFALQQNSGSNEKRNKTNAHNSE